MTLYNKTLRGIFSQEDKRRSDYAYVSFDLPFDAARLEVRYRYSAQMSSDEVEGGNVVDLGLFDPRGREFPGGAGFRGWSGSARDGFYLTPTDATPGYLPGSLPAGRYEVILGLYRIWEQGAEYEIEITAESFSETADSTDVEVEVEVTHDVRFDTQCDSHATANVVIEPAEAWYRGDLQSHTYHSDAKGSLEQLVEKARSLRLDFLAITDHNTVSHHAHLAEFAQEDVLLIPGQEVTTYYGHMNVWRTHRWCDFRASSTDEISAIIGLAHSAGGVCSINHPKTGGPSWDFDTGVDVQAMEVWQGPWPNRNPESLALWDRLLCEGRRLPAVGGSDYHCPAGEETGMSRLGQPTTWVQAHSRTVDDILDAICAGRCCVSAHPDGPRLDLVAQCGTSSALMGGVLDVSSGEPITLRAQATGASGLHLCVISDGKRLNELPIERDYTEIELTLDASRYIRCEIVGDVDADLLPPGAPAGLDLHDWRWAISNPVYVGGDKRS